MDSSVSKIMKASSKSIHAIKTYTPELFHNTPLLELFYSKHAIFAGVYVNRWKDFLDIARTNIAKATRLYTLKPAGLIFYVSELQFRN